MVQFEKVAELVGGNVSAAIFHVKHDCSIGAQRPHHYGGAAWRNSSNGIGQQESAQPPEVGRKTADPPQVRLQFAHNWKWRMASGHLVNSDSGLRTHIDQCRLKRKSVPIAPILRHDLAEARNVLTNGCHIRGKRLRPSLFHQSQMKCHRVEKIAYLMRKGTCQLSEIGQEGVPASIVVELLIYSGMH